MTEIALSEVLDAAAGLSRAARWDDATRLLDAVRTHDPADLVALATARATIAVEQDLFQQTDHGPAAMAKLEQALKEAPDPAVGWDLDFLRLRKDYATELFRRSAVDAEQSGGERAAGLAAAERLAEWAERLQATAPSEDRAGHAAFYRGVMADNLLTAPAEAFSNYTDALAIAERCGDEFLESLALRHLGDHAHTAGDLKLTRSQWERSTELRQRTGHLPGVLAQQALLAVLAQAEGEREAAAALAGEVHRWATQLGLPWLTQQTAALR
jgi:tetratricopeptide (TPR) repeat protein